MPQTPLPLLINRLTTPRPPIHPIRHPPLPSQRLQIPTLNLRHVLHLFDAHGLRGVGVFAAEAEGAVDCEAEEHEGDGADHYEEDYNGLGELVAFGEVVGEGGGGHFGGGRWGVLCCGSVVGGEVWC